MGKNVVGKNVLRGNLSVGKNVVGKIVWGKMSWGKLSLGEKCYRAANINAITVNGKTPYDSAVQQGKEEVAEYLKEQMIALINKKDTFSEDESK